MYAENSVFFQRLCSKNINKNAKKLQEQKY